jgi:hypothetical protein
VTVRRAPAASSPDSRPETAGRGST